MDDWNTGNVINRLFWTFMLPGCSKSSISQAYVILSSLSLASSGADNDQRSTTNVALMLSIPFPFIHHTTLRRPPVLTPLAIVHCNIHPHLQPIRRSGSASLQIMGSFSHIVWVFLVVAAIGAASWFVAPKGKDQT